MILSKDKEILDKIRVMQEAQDPLLSEQKSFSTEGYEYSFVALNERIIVVVSAYIRLIWEVKNFRKTIDPLGVIKNTQTFFKDNNIKEKDALWKEHCAGTLRELVGGCFEADAMGVLKCLPKRAESVDAQTLYENIQKYKEFLNELAHLKNSDALRLAQDILGDQTLTSIEDETFDKLCTNFIQLLHSLFSQYCMRRSARS